MLEPFALGDERNFGYSAAHEAVPLPLLPSGPGGVHGESLHKARSSTHRQEFEPSAQSSIAMGWAKGEAVSSVSSSELSELTEFNFRLSGCRDPRGRARSTFAL